MGNFGLAEFAIMFVLGAALPTYGVIDALRHPLSAWDAAGHSRTLWAGLMGASIFLFLFFLPGALITLLYLAGVRPSLRRQGQALEP